jgi:predicted nuclease with TOPRIM domain
MNRKRNVVEKINTKYFDELKEKLKKPEEYNIDDLVKEIKEKEAGFPNKYWFSDHLPVGCTFTILENE